MGTDKANEKPAWVKRAEAREKKLGHKKRSREAAKHVPRRTAVGNRSGYRSVERVPGTLRWRGDSRPIKSSPAPKKSKSKKK